MRQAKGLAAEAISDYTGLSLAEIKAAGMEAAPPAGKKRKSRAKPAK